jgi:hypothetical protein
MNSGMNHENIPCQKCKLQLQSIAQAKPNQKTPLSDGMPNS